MINSKWWTTLKSKWCRCIQVWCKLTKISRAILLFKMEFRRPCKSVNFSLMLKQHSKFNKPLKLLNKITTKASNSSPNCKVNKSYTSIFLIRFQILMEIVVPLDNNNIKNETLDLLRLIRDNPWFEFEYQTIRLFWQNGRPVTHYIIGK